MRNGVLLWVLVGIGIMIWVGNLFGPRESGISAAVLTYEGGILAASELIKRRHDNDKEGDE